MGIIKIRDILKLLIPALEAVKILDKQNVPEQVIDKNMAASMSLDYIVKGLTIAIETSIKKGNFNGENLL